MSEFYFSWKILIVIDLFTYLVSKYVIHKKKIHLCHRKQKWNN